ncbi:META domain-containing protein [Microcella sp.]|uniref:META domain-containing protein n=1 Tax=Microcella sp. TaxID=1913979 RepID=UPI00256902CA|nr:META domain-containing protein [Microcella sp.]MBX9472969.1 META domain-containing protein [Microcella sp.]
MVRSRLVRTLAVGMLAVSIPMLSACSGLTSGTTALQGEWVLDGGSDAGGVFVDSANPVTLVFEGDSVSGRSPCGNVYSGPVIEGPGAAGSGTLRLGGLSRTEMGCLEQDQNQLESRYFSALEAVDRVAVSDDGESLELTGDDVFVRFTLSEKREG